MATIEFATRFILLIRQARQFRKNGFRNGVVESGPGSTHGEALFERLEARVIDHALPLLERDEGVLHPNQ